MKKMMLAVMVAAAMTSFGLMAADVAVTAPCAPKAVAEMNVEELTKALADKQAALAKETDAAKKAVIAQEIAELEKQIAAKKALVK
jgi:hypothetical protein